MSGTFPTTGFNTMEFKSNTQTRTTQTLSGRTQRKQIKHISSKIKISYFVII